MKKRKFSAFDRTKISNQEARTPEELYKQLDEEFHFDFDPCPSNPTFDGLKIEWGKSNYVNPPYANKKPWIKKAIEEWKKGKTVVMLLPADTSTSWFHDLIIPNATEIRFIRGRIKFLPYNSPAKFPCMVVIFKHKCDYKWTT
ncbi:MAG: DNA N-6-adenine-methyltransferase [Nitrososphaerota archaeon]